MTTILSDTVAAAREQRLDMMLDDTIDRQLEMLFSAKTVGASARFKLRNLLKFYAKNPKPFTACVRDNRKRFPGPGEVERICATIVDLIKGNTHWRKGGHRDSNIVHASDELPPVVDSEVIALLEDLPPLTEARLQEIYNEAREVAQS